MALDSAGDPADGRGDQDDVASLGRRGRTFRQWRLSPAPIVCGVLGAVVALLPAFLLGEWVPPQLWWLLLVPLGLGLGVAFDYFAPGPYSHGQLLLTVYERGLHIRPRQGPPLVLPGRYIDHLAETVDEDFRSVLCLEWVERDGSETVRTTPIENFASHRILGRALRLNRRPSVFAGRAAPTAATVAAVLVWAFLWSISPLTPVPPVPGHERDLARFCDDADLVFEDAPPFEGAGPHAIGFSVEDGRIEGSQSASKRDRGWSTDLAEVELIACGRRESARTVDTCLYGTAAAIPHWSVDLDAVEYRFTVYEAATHDEVGVMTVEPNGGDLQCPPSISAELGETVEENLEARPSWDTVLTKFEPYATSEANTW